LPKGVSVTALSPPITTLFQGQRSLIYAQLTGQSSDAAEGCVTVKYSLAGHPSQNQLHFSLKPEEDTGLTVHRLGARTLIRSLEMEETDNQHEGQHDEGVKKKVVELSVQSGVSSSFTSFIAVNKSNTEPIQGPLVRRDVPIACFSRMTFTPQMYVTAACANFGAMPCYSVGFSDTEGRVMCYDDGFEDCEQSAGAELFCNDEYEELEDDTELFKSDLGAGESGFTVPKQPRKDPLLQLVSLQKASGCWLLDPALAAALGKTDEEVEKPKPSAVKQEVWATILALI
ncbi:von Willebrand factor A domain-containing protein 5A-like, partial [Lates japonicus]